MTAEEIELATEIFDSVLQVLKVYETDHSAQLPMETGLALAAAESLRLPVLHCNPAIDRISQEDWTAWRAEA